MQLFLKVLSGMANNEDSDQTVSEVAVRSWSSVFAYAVLPEILTYRI